MNTEHTFPKLHAANSNNGRNFKSWRIYAEQNNAKPRAVATMESDDLSPEKEMALATLFASAPELLKALDSLVAEATKKTSTLTDMEAFTASIDAARAAIAKAIGH